jgi:serine/threonine-protein kinase RsbW
MDAFTRAYTDLDRAIDEMQSLSDVWPATTRNGTLDADIVHCTSLVLHEWIANLHQHAEFHTDPWVEVALSLKAHRVCCSVRDNSEGFALRDHFPGEDDEMEAFPERGMGLLIIETCTDDLSYTTTDDGLQHFDFTIPADHDPWMNTLF